MDRSKRAYKPTLRKSPYFVSLLFLLVATVLTLLNVHISDLIHVVVRSPGPVAFETQYGLYGRCTRSSAAPNSTFLAPSQPLTASTLLVPALLASRAGADGAEPSPSHSHAHAQSTSRSAWACTPFPTRSECAQFGEPFCVLWSTAAYAAQLSLVPALGALIALAFIFLHRGHKRARARARRRQWKIVAAAMGIHCVLQVLELALVLHVFRTDARFECGARLDKSFYLGVASAITSGVLVLFLTFSGLSARAGKPWAAGTSAREARRHRRTRSGRVVPVPAGTPIPPEQRVTVGEAEAAVGDAARVREGEDADADADEVSERTGLLAAESSRAAGGGEVRATD
ncbi:hypothetical protein Q5752_001069 [Cryptotrichosporon argae]